MAATLTEARSELVRERVLTGLERLLRQGEAWTFSSVAKAAGVPERTVYRYFPTREALLRELFDFANRRVGFHGTLPTDAAGLTAQVRRTFPGFDTLAPVVRELLLAPEGKLVRLQHKAARQRASLALARREAPKLEARSARHLAAVLQLLSQAATWQSLRDYWDMDGAEAAEAAALAVELLLLGARSRPASRATARKRRTKEEAK
jgi:AcrR family transcriptional regulator